MSLHDDDWPDDRFPKDRLVVKAKHEHNGLSKKDRERLLKKGYQWLYRIDEDPLKERHE